MGSSHYSIPSTSPSPPGASPSSLHGSPIRPACGWRAFSDTPRPEAAPTVSALRPRGLDLLLLSGDSEAPVARLAQRLGIPQWQAGLSPEAKAVFIRDWERERRPIAMVGDGLNDGPLLAAAWVGIAVGPTSPRRAPTWRCRTRGSRSCPGSSISPRRCAAPFGATWPGPSATTPSPWPWAWPRRLHLAHRRGRRRPGRAPGPLRRAPADRRLPQAAPQGLSPGGPDSPATTP